MEIFQLASLLKIIASFLRMQQNMYFLDFLLKKYFLSEPLPENISSKNITYYT